jgi:outer membrane protein OmpA-like peptidoglycan-associated protein
MGLETRGKMKTIQYLLLCLALPLAAHVCTAQAKDAKGCKDSPLIARYPGTTIYDCKDSQDDAYNFPGIGPSGTDMHLEGEYHFVIYNIPDNITPPPITRNLVTAFKNAGYTFVMDNGNGHFIVHMGKTWIEENVTYGGNYSQHILIETQLTQEMVANAAALSTGLTGVGHIVVNGILFDTGKADVKPESAAALQEVAKLLKGNGKLKVYVVGHTDNVGVLAANIDLSKRRAAAVVLSLTTQYGVAAAQLQSFGAGPYSPVASNHSEDGRALNRRVELVEQ